MTEIGKVEKQLMKYHFLMTLCKSQRAALALTLIPPYPFILYSHIWLGKKMGEFSTKEGEGRGVNRDEPTERRLFSILLSFYLAFFHTDQKRNRVCSRFQNNEAENVSGFFAYVLHYFNNQLHFV